MIAVSQIGHLALFLFFCVALIGFFGGLGGLQREKHSHAYSFLKNIALVQFILISLSMLCLFYGFVISDFSLKLVYEHSHLDKPIMYKLTALWANHEGSMLLWIWILSLYQMLISLKDIKQVPYSLVFLNLLCLGLGAFILFSSNPFNYISPVPENGLGLNPLLQDPGLAYHPPFLYLGYVGFGAVAALVMGGLFTNQYDKIWCSLLKTTTYFAFMFLTIGITMGSFWAYYELGWGGFWFWDPVENVALIPWLFGIIMIHMIKGYQKTGRFLNWVILSGIFAFIFSLIGTFIVRSGVLISIHSFVSDPNRGIVILCLIAFFSLLCILIYCLYFKLDNSKREFKFFSRDHFILLNGLIVALIAFIVIFGTLYPIVHEAIYHDIISVGAPYFNQMIVPIIFILLLLMGLVHFLTWQTYTKKHLMIWMILGVVLVIFVAQLKLSLFSFLSIILALWVVGSLILDFFIHRLTFKKSLPFLMGHFGFALFVLAVALSTQYSKSLTVKAVAGEKFMFETYDVALKEIKQFQKENYISTQAIIEMRKDGEKVIVLKPERRRYEPSQINLTETSISISPIKNIYAALMPVEQDEGEVKWLVTLHIQFFMIWIWIGGLMIATAIGLALLNSLIFKRKK